MLSIENVLKNYEDLMTKNGYSEIEKLENLQVIRNVLNYGGEPSADSLTYDYALIRYPGLTTWCGIPKSFLDILMQCYIVPQTVSTADNTKYLICRFIGNTAFYLRLDVTNDVYSRNANSSEENAEASSSAYDNTVIRWNTFIIKAYDALNMRIYKYLKDTYPELLRNYVSDDFYKGIDVNYAESQKMFINNR